MSETVADRTAITLAQGDQVRSLRTIESVRIPALVIYGAADPVVPVAVSVERLRVAHPGAGAGSRRIFCDPGELADTAGDCDTDAISSDF
jgi:pimeloyl-ACP methyl ester carboxylesterase